MMGEKDIVDIPSEETRWLPSTYVEEKEVDPKDEQWADDKPWSKENPHLITALDKAMGNLCVTVNVAIKAIRQMMTAINKYVYDTYPNRRVVHLALHGKRARTRKKNRNRIVRDLKREMKKIKEGRIPSGRKILHDKRAG